MVLHLAVRNLNDAIVFHYDYELYMPRVLEKKILANLREINRDKFKVEIVRRGSKDRKSAYSYRKFWTSIQKIAKKYNVSHIISSLREEESIKRKFLIQHDRLFGFKNLHLIRNWTWRDVWAYIVRYNVPYIHYYDRISKITDYSRSRFVTFFDDEFSWKEDEDRFLFFKQRF